MGTKDPFYGISRSTKTGKAIYELFLRVGGIPESFGGHHPQYDNNKILSRYGDGSNATDGVPVSGGTGGGIDKVLQTVVVIPDGQPNAGRIQYTLSDSSVVLGPPVTNAPTVEVNTTTITLPVDTPVSVPIPATWASLINIQIYDDRGTEITEQVKIVRDTNQINVSSAVNLLDVRVDLTGLLA